MNFKRKVWLSFAFLLFLLSLVSCMKVNSYTITFNTNGGNELQSINKNSGEIISLPTPIKEDYTFAGWYTDSNLTKMFISKTMPDQDLTLYAKWIISQYTITFNSNGGTEVTSITQIYNSEVTKPDSPNKEGYVFLGWFSDEDLNHEYTFSTMPKENITLYAKWIINPLTSLSDIEVSNSLISFSAYITDSTQITGNITAEIFQDGTKLNQEFTLKSGDNNIQFINLESNHNYKVKIVTYFNNNETSTTIYSNIFSTNIVTISIEDSPSNSISFSINIIDTAQINNTPIARLYQKQGDSYLPTGKEIILNVGENDNLSFDDLQLGYTYKILIEVGTDQNTSFNLLTSEEILLYIPISNRSELQNIQNNLKRNYRLTTDIDLTNITWGSLGVFEGTLHGAGYSIIGLNNPLFTEISANATVLDLGLENVNINVNTSIDSIGSLTNINRGKIKNVFAIGQITIDSNNIIKVGGISGINYNTVERSFTDINISFTTDKLGTVGGLVGYNNPQSRIINTYTLGDISVTNSSVGGLVGYNGNSIIENSYSVGNITATITDSNNQYYVGGFVGFNNGEIYNSATTSNINVSDSLTHVGSFVGDIGDNNIINNNYHYINQTIIQNNIDITNSVNDVVKADIYTNSFFLNILNWDQSIWSIRDYYLPLLLDLTTTTIQLVPDLSEPMTNREQYDDYLYTMLNEGYDSFTFYCDTTFLSCEDVVNDTMKIFDVMFYYQSYIRFEEVSSSYNSNYITINLETKTYTDQMIKDINQKAEVILTQIISPGMTEREQIKAIHDYIIKKVEYNKACVTDESQCFNSFNAYSVFFEDLTVCDGYSQAFDILVRELGIETHRIPSVEEGRHTWNVVFLDGQWLHIDLTWDDIGDSKFGTGISYNYFLITTEELHFNDSETTHQFDQMFIN